MWLKPQGYAVEFGPNGTQERDTMTCAHCNSVVYIKPKMRPEDMGGFCRMCMKPVCARCADGTCIPFEKKLEILEAQYHARRSYEA